MMRMSKYLRDKEWDKDNDFKLSKPLIWPDSLQMRIYKKWDLFDFHPGYCSSEHGCTYIATKRQHIASGIQSCLAFIDIAG